MRCTGCGSPQTSEVLPTSEVWANARRLRNPRLRPKVEKANGSAGFRGGHRGQAAASRLDPTRLSSSKGQTRRKTATQSHGPSACAPVAARLPKGWAGENTRPSPDDPPATGCRARATVRPGSLDWLRASYAQACPAFFPHPSRAEVPMVFPSRRAESTLISMDPLWRQASNLPGCSAETRFLQETGFLPD